MGVEEFPAVRAVPGVRQPVVVQGCVVTFWSLVSPVERWASCGQLGELLRRLHWLEEPESLGLPVVDPLGETWERIDRVDRAGALGVGDREFLRGRAVELGKAFGELSFVLPRGVVHGDASVGNALVDPEGRAVLIDLDSVALGPQEWDLVLTALYYERFGWHTRSEYKDFVFSYGFDVMNWYGYRTLADLREVTMTIWLATNMDRDTETATEVRRRVTDLRTGADRHGWRPF